MKKTISIVLVLLFLLSFSACNNSPDKDKIIQVSKEAIEIENQGIVFDRFDIKSTTDKRKTDNTIEYVVSTEYHYDTNILSDAMKNVHNGKNYSEDFHVTILETDSKDYEVTYLIPMGRHEK